ncbi:DUF6777 domain-containing protein [Streptomyces sp. 21So2-11]|uniref:DUF6777 domain-containing protein n=1 Tax=Streptomyces sp. 21So2-11 TaxID=3144408 RepID=UPI00321AFF09
MRSPTGRYALTAAALTVGLVAAGCAGSDGKDVTGSQDVLLQPVAAQGPDPFTKSTAKSAAALPSDATRSPSVTGSPSATTQAMRSVSGAEPGLYGGTHSVASCDVDQQVRFLTADRAKGRAFARVSGIDQGAVAGYLRGLTPVLLRADSRVTNHGYRDGSATSFQSVLQAGTAVLVDSHGAPRVRCACGNPLLPPKVAGGTVAHRGQPWSGYRPGQVVVIRPVTQVITNLVIVNIVNNTWIERKTGDDGDRDRTPDVTPTPTDSGYDPDTGSPDPDDPETETETESDPATESESESASESADESSTDPGTSTSTDTTSTDTPTTGTGTGTTTGTTTDPASPPCPSLSSLAPGRPATAVPSVVPPGCPTPPPPPTVTSSAPSVDQP